MMEIACTVKVLETNFRFGRHQPFLECTGVLSVKGAEVAHVSFSLPCSEKDGLGEYADLLSAHVSRLMEEGQA